MIRHHNKTVKIFAIYISLRITVEFIGFSASIFKFSPHFYYHLFSLIEFFLLTSFIKEIYFFKSSFNFIRGFYLLVWIILRVFDLGDLSESFSEPVGFSVWINTVFFITFCGFKLVNYNYKKGLKDPVMLFNLSILVYFLSVIFLLLNKNYIYSSYMDQVAKIEAINEIIRWQAVLMSVSTITYYLAVRYMLPNGDKKLQG